MDIIWIIVGAICLLVGLAGCFLPALPGPPLSYVGMILLHLTDKVQFTATQLIVWAILVIIVQVLDYLTPLIGTKYSGGSKWGNRGCIAGTVIGIFLFPPWGIIFGPLVGAVIGELLGGKLTHEALKAGLGAFVGFLLGGNFKGIALRLFRGCLHFCSILISFLSFLRRKTKNFFSSGMMMARSIVRGDCPCIFQPLSSETVVFSISPLLLRYTPQCYGARQGRG